MTEIIPVEFGALSKSLSVDASLDLKRSSTFAGMVTDGVASVEKSSAVAADILARYAAGEAISAHELMITMEQARLAVQVTVEIRNRLLEAYQEVSRMQI